jgi:uncharacterized protein YqiB (DUF1249 family)
MEIKSIGDRYEEIKKALETETDPQKKEELNKELIIMFDEAKKALLRMQQLKSKDVFHRNYARLERIFGCVLEEIKKKQYLKLTKEPYMALSVDIIRREETGFVISMAHNFVMNGDIVPDPDMELAIDLENKTVEALTFQNSMVFNVVYDYDIKGDKIRVRPQLKKSLNSFLEGWLKNIIEQGHKITESIDNVE